MAGAWPISRRASACRRGLASTQLLLQQKEAELKKLRGESRYSVRRGSDATRRRSLSESTEGVSAEPRAQLAQRLSLLGGNSVRLVTRALGVVELATAWRLYTAPAPASGAPTAPGEEAAAAGSDGGDTDPAEEGAALLTADTSDLGHLLPLMQAVRWQLPAVMEAKQCALLLVAGADESGGVGGPTPSPPAGEICLQTSDATGGGKRLLLAARGVAMEVIRSGASLNLEHGPHHPAYDRKVDLHDAPQTSAAEEAGAPPEQSALLCVPVLGASGQPIGVLQAASRGAGEAFDADDELLLRLAADVVANAVQNAHAHAALAGFSTSLMRLCRDVFSQSSPEGVLGQLSLWAKQLLGASSITASLAAAARKQLTQSEGGGGGGGGGGARVASPPPPAAAEANARADGGGGGEGEIPQDGDALLLPPSDLLGGGGGAAAAAAGAAAAVPVRRGSTSTPHVAWRQGSMSTQSSGRPRRACSTGADPRSSPWTPPPPRPGRQAPRSLPAGRGRGRRRRRRCGREWRRQRQRALPPPGRRVGRRERDIAGDAPRRRAPLPIGGRAALRAGPPPRVARAREGVGRDAGARGADRRRALL